MKLKLNNHEFKTFDIHGHQNGTIPKVFRLLKRRIPPDIKLKDFRTAGLCGGIVCALGDPNTFQPFKTDTYTYVLKKVEKIISELKKANARLVLSASQLDTYTKHEDDLAFIVGIEGADFIEDDLERLSKVYNRGIRAITLIHYTNNSTGTRCMTLSKKEEKTGGLTIFGEKVVKKMNDLGIIIDLAHSNEKTAFEAVEISKKPVLCSHTGPRKLQDFPRFISNDLMKSITLKGGIIGIWGGLYKNKGAQNLKMFSEFVKYTSDLVGIEHVTIGTDFNGVMGNMDGYVTIYNYKNIIHALFEQGFSNRNIEKICFENFSNFFKQISS